MIEDASEFRCIRSPDPPRTHSLDLDTLTFDQVQESILDRVPHRENAVHVDDLLNPFRPESSVLSMSTSSGGRRVGTDDVT